MENSSSCQECELTESVQDVDNERKAVISGEETGIPRKLGSARYTVAIMAFVGITTVYMTRVNLSVAMTAMVNSSYSTGNVNENTTGLVCAGPGINSTSLQEQGEFPWNAHTQELILASFYYGYMITQAPGGLLADRRGGKWILCIGILISSVGSLLGPVAAYKSWSYLFATRVFAGMGEGVTFPALMAIWAKWAPPKERGRLTAVAFAGIPVGNVLGQVISGFLCETDFLGGWPSTFYVFGSVGVLWCLASFVLIYDSPESHPRISNREREYIISTRIDKTSSVNLPVPWLSICTSLPVIAILIAQFANNWGIYTLMTNLPIYLNKALRFGVTQSGVLSALPFVGLGFVMLTGAKIADYLIRHQIMNIKNTRKLLTATAFVTAGTVIVLVGYVGCNAAAAIAFLTISQSVCGLAYSGYVINQLDIAPQYAGLISGIGNSIANLSGIIGPYVVGVVAEDQADIESWKIVFWICFGIYMFATVFYLICASGTVQPWAQVHGTTS